MINPAIHGTRFYPGAVTISNLKEVAQYDEIRVDNKTEIRKSNRARPVSELVSLIELLAYKPGFEYSLFYFNCEQFAVYVKFQGISESEQILKWNTIWKFLSPHWIQMLKEGALLQWEENRIRTRNMQMPQKILPKIIEEYHHFLLSQHAGSQYEGCRNCQCL